MFHYNICTEPDELIFAKQCSALEEHVPGIQKGKRLSDVDGSKTQFYQVDGKSISVHNSYYIGAVYVDSEIELEQFFKQSFCD